jgi:hypothetical protein
MRDRDDCWEKADPRCFCPPIEPPPSPIFLWKNLYLLLKMYLRLHAYFCVMIRIWPI